MLASPKPSGAASGSGKSVRFLKGHLSWVQSVVKHGVFYVLEKLISYLLINWLYAKTSIKV